MTKGQKLFIMLAGIVMIFAGVGYFYKLFADKRNSELSIAYSNTRIDHPQSGQPIGTVQFPAGNTSNGNAVRDFQQQYPYPIAIMGIGVVLFLAATLSRTKTAASATNQKLPHEKSPGELTKNP
jgi:hypothetical protein